MKKTTTAIALLAFGLAACSTDPYTGEEKLSNTAIGATTGALLGGVSGALIGKGSKGSRRGALIGAGIGALAGGGIGLYMDKQEADLRRRLERTGVSVTRYGDDIVLNMPSNITFDVDEDRIRPEFNEVLDSVYIVLDEYNQTYIDVAGHTDSDGSDDYNYDLSERRAQSVARYLVRSGLNRDRFSVEGFGEREPVASNDTAPGKARNRRVEIRLSPLT
jgi:outer membrane protein OmpA-like peptidoglycan-associated protein